MERNHLGNLGVDGRIILNCILSKYGMDWIHLDQRRALVNTVTNLRVT
jgi:hypothetical protein